ncbi:hypothetical protein G9E11_17280 [Arthrobacter sp. IA7]|uniref:hypothetical protein n=1 Tax=Arthrobacter ipis TaxID=2716202 RepID=UPI00188B4331|nr:hypothetical protein [Arthrobacter ipis]MBD1543958.1 hypothetical protein [Arthrobacter ipis]
MAEGIIATPYGEAYLLFESGSYKYNSASGNPAINVINGVHRAKLSTLTSIPGGKIRLGTLHCVEQEDLIGDDETRIRVEDQNLTSRATTTSANRSSNPAARTGSWSSRNGAKYRLSYKVS